MGYIEDDSNFDEDEYDKELEELQEEEKPEKKRDFSIARRKKRKNLVVRRSLKVLRKRKKVC